MITLQPSGVELAQGHLTLTGQRYTSYLSYPVKRNKTTVIDLHTNNRHFKHTYKRM